MIKVFTLLIFLVPSFSYAFEYSKVASCIEYGKFSDFIHVLRIDLTCPNIRLIASDESSKGMPTSRFAVDSGAVVAINGDYFTKNYSPIGLAISNGRLWKGASDKIDRAFFACDKNNRCFSDPGNQVFGADKNWLLAIGGWQSFSDGKFSCSAYANKGCFDINYMGKHPRTAIGFDLSMDHIFLVVAEGRIKGFSGITLLELGDLFNSIGVYQGVNLDGGGSSTLVIKGKRVNRLPEGQIVERDVANHFGVISR